MGYDQSPWEFKGQALYQLSLVKVEEARKYIPPELPLVNFFGWTLGGFYLARYTHSPVGAFDELVALAGLAWNFPTSCAWAARVYVNNKDARDHGISAVGLPSRLASFKAVPLSRFNKAKTSKLSQQAASSWWDQAKENSPVDADISSAIELRNTEKHRFFSSFSRGLHTPVCTIEMPTISKIWAPKIHMALPSFSGGTPDHPSLLKYSLDLYSNIRFIKPVTVRVPEKRAKGEIKSLEVLDSVLTGKPLLCMAFGDMRMEVQSPEKWIP